LGKNLAEEKKEWIYLSSKDCDLTSSEDVIRVFKHHNPDAVIHLAARVGGIKDNVNNQADFYYLNTLINLNVLQSCHKLNINRVLSCLSTCAFPDVVEKYPFTEKDLFSGPPAISNLSYGMTKRMLKVASDSYRRQYGRNYSTFCPSNIYGPHDYFNSDKSHFIPAMISRVDNAIEGSTVEFWGTGNPLRQQLYVKDLCKIIPILLEKHNTDIPIIIAPDQNLSIKETVEIFVKILKRNLKIDYNGKLDGQYRKDGSNKKVKQLLENFEFTDIEKGLKETYEWYKKENSACP
jgi:GDP-L-fucose synthase